MLVMLSILAAIAVHRIWHYESIFSWVPLFRDPTTTPLLIAPGIVALGAVPHPAVFLALQALACYPILRGAVWLYEKYDPPAKACTSCAEKAKQLHELRTWEKRVIMLGVSAQLATDIAQKHPKWAIIQATKDEQSNVRNLLLRKLIHDNPAQTVQEITRLILIGGNAAIVLGEHVEQRTDLLAKLGHMKGVAWIHMQKADGIPVGHRVMDNNDVLDTVIATTPFTR